jgi:ribonuclease Z
MQKLVFNIYIIKTILLKIYLLSILFMSNKIKLFFLGNCASIPTSKRNLSSLLINYDGFNYLFDTPENVQQQIMKAKQSILKIDSIFITHTHGDHLYGLYGLLSSMHLNNRTKVLNIFVPFSYRKKIKDSIKLLVNNINFKINIKGVKSNFKYENHNIIVNSIKLNHNISTYGYIFKVKDKIGKFNKEKALKLGIPQGPLFSKLQKGKSIKLNKRIIQPKDVMNYKYKKKGIKIAYLLDTMVLKKIPKKLKDTNYLVHESTFLKKHALKAKKVQHSILENVLVFSKKLDLKKLFLTHISSRYKNFEEFNKIIKKYYKNNTRTNKVIIVKNLECYEIDVYL